jgi:hypothetical protein
MKYLKISAQHAVRTDQIAELKVTGREDNCSVIAVLKNSDPVTIKWCKSFDDAERALQDTLGTIEIMERQ